MTDLRPLSDDAAEALRILEEILDLEPDARRIRLDELSAGRPELRAPQFDGFREHAIVRAISEIPPAP